MNNDENTDDEYYCSNCRAVIDREDRFCRQCGADTSQLVDEPEEEQGSPTVDSKANPSPAEVAIPISDVSSQTHKFQTSFRPKPRPGLGSAAILLFVMAAFQFVNQVVNNQGQHSGTASSLPVLVNVVIGIGLLRPQGFWNTSQNGYRIWAIIRCFAVPILIAIGMIEPTLNVTGAFIIHSPDLLIAAGILTILLGPAPSPRRVAFGVTLSVIGFIGIALVVVIASNLGK